MYPNRHLTEMFRWVSLKIHETISSLELQSDKKIRHFCVGKTYAEAISNKTFNPNDVDNWKVRGISDRWNKKSAGYKNRGYDGLVVLGAVSRSMASFIFCLVNGPKINHSFR